MEALAVVLVSLQMSGDVPPATPRPETQLASTCFFSYEQESGSNRICYYDCLSGTVAITVPWSKFCPLSIRD